MKPLRIYAVEIVAYPAEACDFYDPADLPEWLHGYTVQTTADADHLDAVLRADWSPDGWDEDDRGSFWWPSTSRLYKSRSAASERASLIESYGALAVLIESDLSWSTVPAANARRKRARNAARIERLREEIRRLGGDA